MYCMVIGREIPRRETAQYIATYRDVLFRRCARALWKQRCDRVTVGREILPKRFVDVLRGQRIGPLRAMDDADRVPAEHLCGLQRTEPEAVLLERRFEPFLLRLLHLLHIVGTRTVTAHLVQLAHDGGNQTVGAVGRAA